MAEGYIIFHLNLAFSSIEENKRKDVITNCYWPMLKLIENTNICIGVELTGWTLKQILTIDKSWVNYFKKLLSENKCELIGSGWSQLIGPLVPYEVNIWNHKIALEYYNKILNVKPNIVLVNEMAFSTSLVDIYHEVGYKGFVMDRDNVKLALGLENENDIIPTHALGNEKVSLPVLWSDSNMFQKFQRVIHKDITINEYVEFIKNSIINNKILPIYTNDIEIFNFRPGRFTTESNLDKLDEWDRIQQILNLINKLNSFTFESPSKLINKINKQKKYVSKITSIKYPIPVKKQLKYNINRWAITGRDDLWLNTKCFQIYKNYINKKVKNHIDWVKLCEFWSSDFRTHITEIRWKKLVNELNRINSINIADASKIIKQKSRSDYVLIKDNENIYWEIKTNKISIIINIRRGLTIKSLGFKSQNFDKVIGTINQGYFNSIKYGVDFYSGGVLVELPLIRKKITDLDNALPKIKVENNFLVISTKIKNEFFILEKSIKISLINEEINLSYKFLKFIRPIGVIRVGLFTFLNDFLKDDLCVSCFNGGKKQETFNVNMNCEHGAPVSSFVSSTTSMGLTGGIMNFKTKEKSLIFKWDTSECAAAPIFKYLFLNDKILSRIAFSLSEIDDTSKSMGRIMPFNIKISTF